MTSDIQFPWGLRIDTDLLVHITELIAETERGLKCECVCPECGKRLISRLGDRNAHCFAHEAAEHGCGGLGETWAHRMGKEAIAKAGRVMLPQVRARYPNGMFHGTVAEPAREIKVRDVRLEVPLPGMRPDIHATREDDGSTLLIEICVTNAVDRVKQAKIAARQVPVIEIYLATHRHADRDRLHQAVVRGASRVWLWHPRQAEIDAALAEQVHQQAELQAELARQHAEEARKQDEMRQFVTQMRVGRSPVTAYPQTFTGPVKPPSFWDRDNEVPPVVSCGCCQCGSWWSPVQRDAAMPRQRAWICAICHPPVPGREIDRFDYGRLPSGHAP